MNIMLVSVTRAYPEIGLFVWRWVQSERDILKPVSVEAVLCVIGGAIGLLPLLSRQRSERV
jgi:hypothetical protein